MAERTDYRVLAEGDVEVGAGWNKAYGEGKKNTFISVLIDDQSLERPIAGSVFDNKDGRSAQMVWSRPSRSHAEESICRRQRPARLQRTGQAA